jgi:hypothetical protein
MLAGSIIRHDALAGWAFSGMCLATGMYLTYHSYKGFKKGDLL